MPCRPNRLTRDRIRVPRGFRARISVFTVVQSWAAAVGLVELHTEGLHRWILTLPPAITAVVEMWHDLRSSVHANDPRPMRSNYAEEVIEERRIR